jgi:hypothetical protein
MARDPPKLNRGPDGVKLILSRHLPYEIFMLRHAFKRANESQDGAYDGLAFIEAFCIHARNLIDFYRDRGPQSENKAYACHFTKESYAPFKNGGPDATLYGKLSEQVAHLSYGRTWNDAENISQSERSELLRLAELPNFLLELKDVYKASFQQRSPPISTS